MQNTMMAAANEISARAWKLSALFCITEHPNIYDSRMQSLPEYVRGLLLDRLQYMRKNLNTMHSLHLISFIMPRAVKDRHDVPVIIILHGSTHVLGLSTVEALLSRTIGVTVTCMPLDFGQGKEYPDVTSHCIYTAFLRLSSKNTGPDVDASLYHRVDIEGNSDARQETIATHEEKYAAWKFTATFDPSLHPELVITVNDRCEVSEDYIGGILNQTIVKRLALFSFAVPLNLSSLSNHPPVHVTGMLRSHTMLRRRTVKTVFPNDDGEGGEHAKGRGRGGCGGGMSTPRGVKLPLTLAAWRPSFNHTLSRDFEWNEKEWHICDDSAATQMAQCR